MNKQDILNLEGTLVNEEQLTKIIESEEVIEVAGYGYYSEIYEDCIGYMITLDDGTEIEIYSYF